MSHGHSTITCLQDPSSRTGRDGNTRDIVRFVKLAPQKKVTWDKNTIDNEHANKKSSKGMFNKKIRWKKLCTVRKKYA
ncbi:protein phosphatase inhibitor 3 [Plasmodium yoelii yoelii]|uniref:Protein phosphatase inhibitor 3 n=1 Tax=Plasmodium yoelii yoelii TaxID=73239 RepID=A0AAE9WSK9_PLAYO|nr:protein phosphatase inhibitor 3 [Plasmodium yoelii yoelii]